MRIPYVVRVTATPQYSNKKLDPDIFGGILYFFLMPHVVTRIAKLTLLVNHQ